MNAKSPKKQLVATIFGSVPIIIEPSFFADITVLNPWFRVFCPGIWIGIIFISTGGLSLAYYRVDNLHNKRISIVDDPPAISNSQIFRIVFQIFAGTSLALSVAMVIVLAITINALREENRSATESVFSMLIAMLSLYILEFIVTLFGLLFALRHQHYEPKITRKSELQLVCPVAVTALPA